MKKIILVGIAAIVGTFYLMKGKPNLKPVASQPKAVTAPVLPGPRQEQYIARPPLVTKPEFQRAVVLGEKVLHSKKELAEYRQLLSNEKLIQEGLFRLIDTGEKALGPEAQEARMQTIDFLNAAMTYKENPRREMVIKAIQSVVERSVSQLDVSLELKRSLAGDAMELYWVLHTHEPTRAQDIFEKADTQQQRLFRFATQMSKQAKNQKNSNEGVN